MPESVSRLPSKREIIYASPPTARPDVLEELRAMGLRNNVSAYLIQKQLHQLFVQPDFASLPEGTRVQLRRLQGVAFEGYSLPTSEIEAIGASLDPETAAINRKTRESLGELSSLLEKQSASWKKIEEGASELGFNGNGDMLRIWQDHGAVDLFARDFGGRIGVFGSARLGPETKEHRAVEWLTAVIVEGMADEEGRTEQIVSGAGPGIMKASNKGALRGEWKVLKNIHERFEYNPDELEERMFRFRQQIHSAGFRITLPFEAGYNAHLQMNLTIKNFGPRKQGLVAGVPGRSVSHDGMHKPWHKRHPGFFIGKGGFGTEDEKWEVLTLLQCGKMPGTAVFLLGSDTRAAMDDVLRRMEDGGTIDPKDRNLVIPCDNEVEAVRQYLAFHKIDQSPRMKELLSARKAVLS